MKGGFNLKKVKLLFRYIMFFVIGNVIFNTIYSIIKVFTLNQIGGNEKYISNWLFSFKETLIIYAYFEKENNC